MGCLIGDGDKCLFDSVAQEVIRLSGVNEEDAIIFQLNEEESQVHPLYAEPMQTEYKKNAQGTYGIKCPLFFELPDRTPVAGEEGYRVDKISKVWIADKDLRDRDLRDPRIGDIIYVWNLYFDVTDFRKEGVPNDAPTTSMWMLSVVRRTKVPPESLMLDVGL